MIWTMADARGQGVLDRDGLFTALDLIGLAQSHPDRLPSLEELAAVSGDPPLPQFEGLAVPAAAADSDGGSVDPGTDGADGVLGLGFGSPPPIAPAPEPSAEFVRKNH